MTASQADLARGALERVCSGACVSEASNYYDPTFVDHVNGANLVGFKGIESSVAQYKRMFSELSIEVTGQVVSEGQVASRFVVRGKVLSRVVQFDGITISRFKDGLIVEDWSVTDTMSLIRQLGRWRALVILFRAGAKKS
jgi:predicted ester cyclase